MVGFKKTEGAEKPEGEWNTYEITLDGPSLTVIVNGKTLNEANGAKVFPGHIALQSEGGEIHFRERRADAAEVIGSAEFSTMENSSRPLFVRRSPSSSRPSGSRWIGPPAP